jgi:hypothetical protein
MTLIAWGVHVASLVHVARNGPRMWSRQEKRTRAVRGNLSFYRLYFLRVVSRGQKKETKHET